MMEDRIPFSLDVPTGERLPRIARVAGWYMTEGRRSADLAVTIDGAPVAGLLSNCFRGDLPRIHTDNPWALRRGFAGHAIVPDSVPEGAEITLGVVDLGRGETLAERTFVVDGPPPGPIRRETSFDLVSLLRGVSPSMERVEYRLGKPHFLRHGTHPLLQLSVENHTHPYSRRAADLLESHADGVCLDFGAGNVPESASYPHVVRLDVLTYPSIDIVSTSERLPFRDNVFDAVVSQSVFEHLEDPAQKAWELWRVMKPGARAIIDTAFLQPVHADPSHYFNMTAYGFEQVLSPFRILDITVEAYQRPSNGLIMQLEHMRYYIADGVWRDRVTDLVALLRAEGAALDQDLGEIGRDVSAAGYAALVEKA